MVKWAVGVSGTLIVTLVTAMAPLAESSRSVAARASAPRAIISEYCLDCHNRDDAKGGFVLEGMGAKNNHRCQSC